MPLVKGKLKFDKTLQILLNAKLSNKGSISDTVNFIDYTNPAYQGRLSG